MKNVGVSFVRWFWERNREKKALEWARKMLHRG